MTVKVNMGNDSSSNTLGMVKNIMDMFGGGKKGEDNNSNLDAMKRKKKKNEEFSKANEPAGITGSN